MRSGHYHWALADVTPTQGPVEEAGCSAAAEFELPPLLADLKGNRPLRLGLPGVFSELPVPPYVVAEWRLLPAAPSSSGSGPGGSRQNQGAGLQGREEW